MPLINRRRAALSAGVALLTALAAVSVSGSAVAKDAATSGGSDDIVYTVHPLEFPLAESPTAAFPTPPTTDYCLHRSSLPTPKVNLYCYNPSQIRSAYDIPASWTGAGTSIAIIDAYGSPTAASDLAAFSSAFGLPQADFHVYYPGGQPKTQTAHDAVPGGWAGETSLDIEWAHAIAPEATINLVVAAGPYGNVINNAVQYAVDHHLGDVISMSYGSDEYALRGSAGNNLQIQQARKTFDAATKAGIALFASAGDNGASDGLPLAFASYPASDPDVISVGGTNLILGGPSYSTYDHETVWNDTDPAQCLVGCGYGPIGATGGAPSRLFATPSYQSGLGLASRTTSDVAYNASVYTGVLVFDSSDGTPHIYFTGGTSAGAPQWAGIAALALQQARAKGVSLDLGTLLPSLYKLAGTAAFHDVTEGDNAYDDLPGFPAKVGYDDPTGLGTPDVQQLVTLLLK